MKNKDELSDLLFDIIFTIVLFFGIIGCTLNNDTTDYFQCKTKSKKMGLESDWGPIQGCMVKVDDQWIDINKYHIME